MKRPGPSCAVKGPCNFCSRKPRCERAAPLRIVEGVDTGLFENLRKLRRDIAGERGIPPFVVFNDATLRDMAKVRPGSLPGLRRIRGVGDEAADLGPRFVEAITSYCTSRGLPVSAEPQSQPRKSNDAKVTAFEMFSRREISSASPKRQNARRAPYAAILSNSFRAGRMHS